MRTNNVAALVTAVLLLAVSGLAAAAQGATLPPKEAEAAAQLNATPRHGEWVSYDDPAGGKVDAWVVYPERSAPAPVVVVVHEIFGLSDWVRAVADQFAAEGFIAIAPDFLSGKAPGGGGSRWLTVDAARALNSALDPKEVARRIDGAVAYATSLPAATKKFGVVGFCWGGGISFSYATVRPDLGASAVFYGALTAEPAATEMKRIGKSFEYEVYAGAGHGFLRQQDGQNGANLSASQQAWSRVLRFFKDRLESPTASLPGAAPALASGTDAFDDCCDPAAPPTV
jgi:carboxymethylenebutenolidase